MSIKLVLCPGHVVTQARKPLTLRQENAILGFQELFVVVAGFGLVCFFFKSGSYAVERHKLDLRAEHWGLLL